MSHTPFNEGRLVLTLSEGRCALWNERGSFVASLLHRLMDQVQAQEAIFCNVEPGGACAARICDDAEAAGSMGMAHWIMPLRGIIGEGRQTLNVGSRRRMVSVDQGRLLYSIHPGRMPGSGEYISLRRQQQLGPFGPADLAILNDAHAQPLGGGVPLRMRGRAERLPQRQAQVLQLLLGACSEKEIALRLGISYHTVHIHVKALYQQFSVHSRGELMSLLLRNGAADSFGPPALAAG